MKRRLLSSGTLAALVALTAACEQGSTLPGAEGITRAEVESIAPDYDLLGAAVVDGFGLPAFSISGEGVAPAAATVTSTTTFSNLRNCPQGGTVTVAGTITRTFDRETRSGTQQSTATRTENACAFRGRGGATITLNGSPNVQITSSSGFTNGVPEARTMTQKGAFTWQKSTGQSGTCTVDLTSTFTPATHTHTVKGTFCGHTIDLTHTRTAPSA